MNWLCYLKFHSRYFSWKCVLDLLVWALGGTHLSKTVFFLPVVSLRASTRIWSRHWILTSIYPILCTSIEKSNLIAGWDKFFPRPSDWHGLKINHL